MIERDNREPELTKRYNEIEVDKQEIEINIGGYMKNRQR